MRVGITGHQRLDEPANWAWVRKEMDRVLVSLPRPLIGISSLAIGADQVFANAVLERGGTLEVIVPFVGYESTFSEQHDRQAYLCFLASASRVDVLERDRTDQESYFASGKIMIDRSELVIAVWNGKPALGFGGTGDIVANALEHNKRVVQINPATKRVTAIGV